MRHGEAAWTTPDPERALTERGREASRRVLGKLVETDPPIDRILVSPYRRARQTAAEAEALLQLKAQEHSCLTPDESPPSCPTLWSSNAGIAGPIRTRTW